jgi:formimidoylglutamate deiminase
MGIVDEHWCLVHATHATQAELRDLAQTQAVVGLCPTTEANLGDGRFPFENFLAAGGRFGIGTDSQVSIDPRDELRTIEYTMRLWRQQRILGASHAAPNCGTFLYSASAAGGAQALGLAAGAMAPGAPADIVVIDTDRPEFAGVADAALLDAYVLAPRPGQVRDVLVGGSWVLRDRQHPQRESIAADYARCVQRLLPA